MRLGCDTVLGHVLRRVVSIPGVDQTVVATTAEPEDDAVEYAARRDGLRCVRLSARLPNGRNDVLARYHLAARESGASVVLRITADCPLLDPLLAGAVLRTLLASGAGYASNIYPVRTYPDGLDVEAFTRHALNVAFRLARDDADREHVTPYIQRTNTKVCLAHPEDLSLVRWTLDAPEDLERLHVLWHRVMAGSPPPSPTFGWRATMRAHREVEREDSR